jgi:hypothetical protein
LRYLIAISAAYPALAGQDNREEVSLDREATPVEQGSGLEEFAEHLIGCPEPGTFVIQTNAASKAGEPL